MSKKHKEIYDFPLDKIEKGWPFDQNLTLDLFYGNSFNSYESLYDYISDYKLAGSGNGETAYDGFFVKNDKCCYFSSDPKLSTIEGIMNFKLYILDKISYSLIVCSAIRFILAKCSEEYSEFYSENWSFGVQAIMEYLMFSSIPVKTIIEENTVLKRNKKKFLYEVYKGFLFEQAYSHTKVNSFFSKNDCKQRLLDVFLYSEISITKAEALTEDSCIQKDLSNIIAYYGEISK